MDNRIFNVNGSGFAMLEKTLALAFDQDKNTASHWRATKENGLILLWTDRDECHPLINDSSTAEDVAPMVWQWLNSDASNDVQYGEFCEDHDHDGHNSNGWQVYCEAWGHVANDWAAICAVRPAFMWHGK